MKVPIAYHRIKSAVGLLKQFFRIWKTSVKNLWNFILLKEKTEKLVSG